MNALKVKAKVHFKQHGRSKKLSLGAKPVSPIGRVPRVAKYMALAMRFEQLLAAGEVQNYAEIARLANVTRARVTQIMNLLLLAPDLQERLLFLPRIEAGRDTITLGDLQAIALQPSWEVQRRMMGSLASRCQKAS